jgi:hypothetical protein
MTRAEHASLEVAFLLVTSMDLRPPQAVQHSRRVVPICCRPHMNSGSIRSREVGAAQNFGFPRQITSLYRDPF